MSLYNLNFFVVLQLKPKAVHFLKGLATNTAEASKTAFVTIQGKIVVTCFQLKLSDDEVLLVVNRDFVDRLKKHLKAHLDLSDVMLEELPLHVYVNTEGTVPDQNVKLIPFGPGQLVLSEKVLDAKNDLDALKAFRLKHNLPLQGIDFDDPMLLNVSDAYVSFTKGCFLGQEVLARVHNLGNPAQKLIPTEKGFQFVKNE